MTPLERAPQHWQPPRTGWCVSSQPSEFMTNAARVSGPWSVPRPSLTWILSIIPRAQMERTELIRSDRAHTERPFIDFFKEFATNTGDTSIGTTPLLER